MCTHLHVFTHIYIYIYIYQYSLRMQGNFAFVAFYTLIGVPLFGWTVSTVGAVFADKIMKVHTRSNMYVNAYRYNIVTFGIRILILRRCVRKDLYIC